MATKKTTKKKGRGKLLKTVYKVWTTIEVIKTYENDETYQNVPQGQYEPSSLGEFSTLDKAQNQSNLLGDMHRNDGDEDI